jgi:aromatic-L-amino-acid/L-tryptophan decarboxylase
MTPEEFRQAGHELIDWIANYRSTLADGPVVHAVSPGDIRASMSATPPTETLSMTAMLAELDRVVVPTMMSVQHPNYLGFFPANASLASVLGDLASGGLGGLGISWQSCPPLTEVEEVTVDWMRQLVGLSDAWRGTIHDTASTATFIAMVCARERASGFSARAGGIAGGAALVAYASDQAHSSIPKAVLVAGYGSDNLRIIKTDGPDYALDPKALDAAMAADVAAGRTPAVVVAAVGATATTAMDPVRAIVEVANKYDAWVHVDAAMAGSAMLLPEMRHLWDGVEGADSVTWNPHKWMGTILDTSLFYVRDPNELVRVLATDPSYLQSPVDGLVTQFRDWGLPLGRRFRAMKLWFHLSLDGVEAIQTRLRRDLINAQWLAGLVEATPHWRVVAPVPLQTVCVRYEPPEFASDADALDRHTLTWATAVNASGSAFISPAKLDGRWMVRLSIGAEPTERHHLESVWSTVRHHAESVPSTA